MKPDNEQTITTAVQHHAVLLNRPAWLDPARLDVQLAVWEALIKRCAAGRAGTITIDDFDAAIMGVGGLGGRDAREVVPGRIIADAVGHAIARADAARALLDLSPDLKVYDEHVRLKMAMERARTAMQREEAVTGFWAAVAAKIATLETSGYTRDRIDPVIEMINEQAENIVDTVIRDSAALDRRREVIEAALG